MSLALSVPLRSADQPPQRPPAPAAAQAYPAEQVEAGRVLFAAQCGFCHGRDAMGGEIGPDLTRSPLVAEDKRGDKISAVVRSGRPDKKMPAFNLSGADMAAIVAFIHDATARAGSAAGSRRNVDPDDLQTGDPRAGQRYFEGAGGCTRCHSATGDLAGVASRFQGLSLMQRMLYPSGRGRRGGPPPAPPSVIVTLPSGQVVSGKLAFHDEFTIALRDGSGTYRSWPASRVKFTLDDRLDAHFAQLAKYTNDDLHNVLAYLQTLK
jgi:cytochrome c oxidase cbb3-type subunit 3